MQYLIENYYETTSIILFAIGLLNLLLQKNLIKKFIGLNIMDTAVYLFLASKGYIYGRKPPIIVDGVVDSANYINPVPAGLVLTGIVVGVSTTAFSLALTYMLYRHYGSINIDEIMRKAKEDARNDAIN